MFPAEEEKNKITLEGWDLLYKTYDKNDQIIWILATLTHTFLIVLITYMPNLRVIKESVPFVITNCFINRIYYHVKISKYAPWRLLT